MKNIKVAVLFDQEIRSGGGHQQSLNAALVARDIPADVADIIFFSTLPENVCVLREFGIEAVAVRLTVLDKINLYIRRRINNRRFFKIVKSLKRYNRFEQVFVDRNIDLIYFLSPSSLARDLEELNYITTVWDLCHRDDHEFPEVRWFREFESREMNYWAVLPRAVAVLVDSAQGMRNVVSRYGVDENRVHIMPFQPSLITRGESNQQTARYNVHHRYSLDVQYVFYPAQFWAHKNHVYLLEGLDALNKIYGIRIGAIFSGEDKGNLEYVKEFASRLGLNSVVKFIGFVPNEDMPEIYTQSLALVMPTYFGPTNLPPLEAFTLKVPVLYPNKDGLREQIGDAGLLFDLQDPESLARQLYNLINDVEIKQKLQRKGRNRIEYFESVNRLEVLLKIVNEFKRKRQCWR